MSKVTCSYVLFFQGPQNNQFTMILEKNSHIGEVDSNEWLVFLFEKWFKLLIDDQDFSQLINLSKFFPALHKV